MPLPPFNPDATCPKCGYDKINCQWRRASGAAAARAPADEWLSRCCARCGFIWDEACVSSSGEVS